MFGGQRANSAPTGGTSERRDQWLRRENDKPDITLTDAGLGTATALAAERVVRRLLGRRDRSAKLTHQPAAGPSWVRGQRGDRWPALHPGPPRRRTGIPDGSAGRRSLSSAGVPTAQRAWTRFRLPGRSRRRPRSALSLWQHLDRAAREMRLYSDALKEPPSRPPTSAAIISPPRPSRTDPANPTNLPNRAPDGEPVTRIRWQRQARTVCVIAQRLRRSRRSHKSGVLMPTTLSTRTGQRGQAQGR